MENPHWIYKKESDRLPKTFVMQLMPTELVWAAGSPSAMANVVERLDGGQDAAMKNPKVLARSAIAAVDYEDGESWVRVRDGAGQSHKVFVAAKATIAERIARELSEQLQLPQSPSTSPASVLSISKLPAILAALIGVLTVFLYVAANSESKSDSVRVGRAKTIEWLADTVGPVGVLAIGGLLLAGVVAYWAYMFVKRPVVYSFGQPMPSA